MAHEGRYTQFDKNSPADEPPNSRLFIVGNKRLTETDFREAFSKFGEIEDIWVVKDRRTGDNKGVTYIKYSRTTEAAHALEAMNGKIIGGSDRTIKVMIASSRSKGSQREENEDEKIHRLFVLIPKTMTEGELENYFKQFGDIDYVNIVRDKETKESKGFAYIKYYKFSHAAKAFEECDRKYKAVFSEPRKPNMGKGGGGVGPNKCMEQYSSLERMPPPPAQSNQMNMFENSFNNEKSFRLMIIGSPQLTEDQLWKLCNIVPGLEFCKLHFEGAKRRSVGTAVYSSLQWASYACEKLHGFEYPTGSRLVVKPDGTCPRAETGRNLPQRPPTNSFVDGSNLRQLAETIAQATSLIQSAGINPVSPSQQSQQQHGHGRAQNPGDQSSDYCNILKLPGPQPLANVDAETEARCFIVCTPPPPPPAILRDLFCRFGNLIEVYMLANRNCGYAKYASRQSAEEAIKILHGAEICGGRMKVMPAEERSDNSRKRLRLDE